VIFDLRLPIGILFTLLGLLLAVFGLVTPAEIYQRSLGINVNLAWGLVILAFGALMLFVALRARLAADKRSGE
jgi:hypothetical protein